ncbi:Glycine--tRNA ligase beta subunit (Fragment) [Geodia barretti]|uniref:glycine--tRNA ligase n=1 Tax=Geodia barretti TaxID=519541 RepID=A0AA35T124_GEOBA
MGRRYAEIEGESSAVATAIGEHYSPRTANDALPQSEVGRIVAITDRIDSLLGLMAAGEKVKADRDPFSLRRMALAVLRIIIECDVDLDLNALLHESARIYTKQNSDDDTVANVFEFMLERLRSYYLDQGYLADEFAAVYELKPARPLEFDKRLRAVRQFRELAEYGDLIAANKRISNILRQSGELKGVQVKPELLVEQSELQLYEQAMNLSKQIVPLIRASDHGEILRKLAVLRDPIDSFFDDVMVMAEDKQIRRNRVALVGFVSRLFREVAEISLLQPVKVNG